MKRCGSCVYPVFKPEQVNCCLFPMPVGDKRRERRVTPETECFTDKWTDKNPGKTKGLTRIEQMKNALKNRS